MYLPMRSWFSDVARAAAVLVAIAALLASLAWILSGRSSGCANDLKTAALGFMMLRLEAATEASNALVQAQSFLTQAGMYYAQAEAAEEQGLRSQLNALADQSIEMSEFQALVARDAEGRGQLCFDSYVRSLDDATVAGRTADRRSTAALILNVSATVASMAVLLRRRWLLLVFAPVFLLGLSFLIASLL